jgi:hypothetical protein
VNLSHSIAHRLPVVLLGVGLMVMGPLLAGCESLHLYEGKRLPKDELAQITGDSRISGSLPVTVTIRTVDEEELGLRYRGAYVLPGEHDLLIDCTVTESKQTSRHHLHVSVDAGVKYSLVADTGPGNRACADVQIVARY